MRQALLVGLASLFLTVGLPAALLEPIAQPDPVVVIVEQPGGQTARTVKLDTGLSVEEIPLEEYLVGVLLSEIPVSFPMEAMKAQAVAARTFALRQMEAGKHEDWDLCAESSCCQAWSSREELEGKFGSQMDEAWETALLAVQLTSGQVMTYEGELIEAVYFSCAGGQTEDAVAVWGSEVPYLQSVSSPEKDVGQAYASEVVMTAAEFRASMMALDSTLELEGTAATWFGENTRTRGGGVASIEIGGQWYSGTQLRAALGLRSTNFTVSVSEEIIIFQVLGFGHRVGMSQYGAAELAESGLDYGQILTHYYTGITVEMWE